MSSWTTASREWTRKTEDRSAGVVLKTCFAGFLTKNPTYIYIYIHCKAIQNQFEKGPRSQPSSAGPPSLCLLS